MAVGPFALYRAAGAEPLRHGRGRVRKISGFEVRFVSFRFLSRTGSFLASAAMHYIPILLQIAFMFATERTQRGYRKLRRPIDALCGAALVGLGAKLVAER